MRACGKRFKYRPEGTRWKRRKNPNTNREKGTVKEETKEMEPKLKLVMVPVSSRQG